MTKGEMRGYVDRMVLIGTSAKGAPTPLRSPHVGFHGTKEGRIVGCFEEKGAVMIEVAIRDGQGSAPDRRLVVAFGDPCWRFRFGSAK